MCSENPTDRELLEAWRAGEAHAGAKLFRRHYACIARFFANKVGNDGEDLIQATFLGCIESIELYRGEANFKNYLFGIARNKLLQYLRERARDNKYFDAASVSVAASLPSGTSVIANRRKNERVLAALRRLPVDTQMMLELFYWEGTRVRDIAVVMGLPVNTVKCHMRRGRLKLERELASLVSEAGAGSPAESKRDRQR